MAYIGRIPQVGNYFTLDAITASSTATYNLLKGGVAYVPETAYHLIVSLNGVIQAPITAYTVSGSQIIFDSALSGTDSIDFITVLGDTLAIGTPSDGTVTNAKIVDMAATKLTGSIADARVPASAVTQHVTGYDDSAIRADISALALREATNEASAAFNLPNSFIDTFATDVLGTKTDVSVISGYVTTINNITPTISGAGGSQNASPSYSLNTSTGLITLDNSSVTFTTPIAGTGNHWSILDFGQDVTFSTGLMVELISGVAASDGNVNVGLCELNIKNNAGSWVFGSGGITPSAFANNFSNSISSINDIVSQGLEDYDGVYNSATSGLPVRASYSWSGTATGRYLYVVWSNTHGEPSTYKVYDGSNGSTGHGNNLGVAGSKSLSNATGTAIQNTNTVGSAKTEVSGTIIYKDNSGTATLGTDLKIYFTCNGGSNWTEASSYNAITPVYATGIKQVRLGKTTCTSGTDVRYKAVWANQASGSKETQLHGISINY